MKETIYTIPINDAYDIKCGCPICTIEKKLETESLEYVMGAAMMEPDVRLETNRLGFCEKHFDKMLTMKNRLSLALMLQSYLTDLIEEGLPEKSLLMTKKKYENISKKLSEATQNCFVCDRVNEKLGQYIRNVVYLWQSDSQFQAKTREQEYFCPKHLALLLEAAKKGVSRSNYSKFCEDHFNTSRKKLSSLLEDVTKFCNSYNYMFRDVPLGDANVAVERTIDFLNGREEKK
ncbi:MAG: hypothetical protein E7473_04085 [Ruminococcaceae bacterium]|nr:hypothetical protein [Oscillospiraceae bacterium]